MNKVSIDQFASEINAALEEYQETATAVLQEEVRNAAKTARKIAREKAPSATGGYKKGIRTKTDFGSSTSAHATVYSGDAKAPLNHLLENGHAKRGGGRTRAFPHMGPAQDAADEYLLEALPRRLEEG